MREGANLTAGSGKMLTSLGSACTFANVQNTDLDYIARKTLLLMVTRFGVRPNGSIYINQLTIAVQNYLQLSAEDVAAGIDYSVEHGWLVQQQNGLVRITDAGFTEA